MLSPLLQELIQALRCLPGVGPKSAQRMVFHLLERDRSGGNQLVQSLQLALKQIQYCELCRMLSESPLCVICSNTKREGHQLCVVESPADVLAIEQTGYYRGHYFVLRGRLSPLDGIGPSEIGLEMLLTRLHIGDIQEVILATSLTVEGEATAHYITSMAKPLGVRVSRIAHGVPLGSELEYIDSGTLVQAMMGRQVYE